MKAKNRNKARRAERIKAAAFRLIPVEEQTDKQKKRYAELLVAANRGRSRPH